MKTHLFRQKLISRITVFSEESNPSEASGELEGCWTLVLVTPPLPSMHHSRDWIPCSCSEMAWHGTDELCKICFSSVLFIVWVHLVHALESHDTYS